MTEPDEHYLKSELSALLRKDGEIWSFLQQGSLDGVWYWDLERPENEWISPEFWRLFGIDPATKTHDPAEWQDIIFPDDLEEALENFNKHCADPDHAYDQVVRYLHADGSTVWVRCRGIAIRDASGKPLRMLGAHNDFTAIKRNEIEARAAAEEAANANAELREFAYSLSHDLKAPANTVDMLLTEIDVADEGGLNADQREMLGQARQTVEHMQRLVDDMLSFTRVIGEKARSETVSLEHIAHKTCADLAASIQRAKAKVTIEDLPDITGHPRQISTLFQNLIENGLKYRHPERPPEITISARPVGSRMISVDFADNGIGIEPEHHDRIFQLFKRLHRGDEVDGVGLGLTLCRRIAQNHCGTLGVASEAGRGSTFSLEIPRIRP
ncbi:MAG: PAS domain-containing protein [Boseongicola sp.]|nr:PAS domain-containing protein [Boseongicola sp.]